MRVVLDASAAVEVVLDRKGAVEPSKVLADADQVLAPELFVVEVANTFWKYHEFEHLSLAVCEEALDRALSLVDRWFPVSNFIEKHIC